MKRICFTIVLLFVCAAAAAQTGGRPSWLTKLPEPGNDSYYYRVTMAEARTYEKAYAKAFAMAILESSWKLGVVVDTKADVQTLEQGILDNISVQQSQMVLPLNKVCEHTEQLNSSMNIRLYVLWQVASSGSTKPQFEPINSCR